MNNVDIMLLVLGSTLTLLALVSGFFILTEVAFFVRDLGSGRRAGILRSRIAGRKSGDTGPLKPPWQDDSLLQAEHTGPERVQPMRDTEVVRQLIEHFRDGDSSGG